MRGRDDAIANITFHGVGKPDRALASGEDRVWLPLSSARELLDAIVAEAAEGNGGPAVNITIDDGNRSDVRVLAPALANRGLTGTFFICAGRIGVPGFVDAFGVRDLAGMGMRIGSHGMDHISWRGLDRDRLKVEIGDAKARLEDTVGAGVHEAACPFGEYDRRSLRALEQSGFRRVFTSDGIGARDRQWLQPRLSLKPEHTPDGVAKYIRAAARRPWRQLVAIAVKRWR